MMVYLEFCKNDREGFITENSSCLGYYDKDCMYHRPSKQILSLLLRLIQFWIRMTFATGRSPSLSLGLLSIPF